MLNKPASNSTLRTGEEKLEQFFLKICQLHPITDGHHISDDASKGE